MESKQAREKVAGVESESMVEQASEAGEDVDSFSARKAAIAEPGRDADGAVDSVSARKAATAEAIDSASVHNAAIVEPGRNADDVDSFSEPVPAREAVEAIDSELAREAMPFAAPDVEMVTDNAAQEDVHQQDQSLMSISSDNNEFPTETGDTPLDDPMDASLLEDADSINMSIEVNEQSREEESYTGNLHQWNYCEVSASGDVTFKETQSYLLQADARAAAYNAVREQYQANPDLQEDILSE